MKRFAAIAVAAFLATACGGGTNGDKLTVFAASSLIEVFQELASDARFNFAGSDELATQLREGAEADVYAAASPRHPNELFSEGLIKEPRIFATNRLVLIVPTDNPAGIESVADLRRDGVRLVIGAEGVPIGDYTRTVIAKLGAGDLIEQAVSQEEDVKGVVSKVALGEADAGFVYATDVTPVEGDVRAIELPLEAQAEVRYPIAVVTDAEHREEAERFVALVLGARGREVLAGAGFGLP